MSEKAPANVLALIPARGGSKGIPRKNVITVAGLPLIAHSIKQAQQSSYITRVIVSTDDDEIADVSRSYGAETPFVRPAEFAQDLSPDIDAFRHALVWLHENEGYHPDLVVHLRATGPVRRVELIDEAILIISSDPSADSLRSVSWPIQTPYKMWRMGSDDYLEPLLTVEGLPDSHSMARQMLPEVFWQNGYVDIIRPRAILEMNSMVGNKVIPFIVNEPIYELDYAEGIPVLEEALGKLARGEPLVDADPDDAVTRHPI